MILLAGHSCSANLSETPVWSQSFDKSSVRIKQPRCGKKLSAKQKVRSCTQTYVEYSSRMLKKAVQQGRSEYFPILLPHLRGVAEAALYCAHRTSTFLSCAFCEQEGHLAGSPLPFSAPCRNIHPFARSLRRCYSRGGHAMTAAFPHHSLW
jgi:hypothetical protein